MRSSERGFVSRDAPDYRSSSITIWLLMLSPQWWQSSSGAAKHSTLDSPVSLLEVCSWREAQSPIPISRQAATTALIMIVGRNEGSAGINWINGINGINEIDSESRYIIMGWCRS